MALSGKMSYTQSDEALTTSNQTVTFSVDGTNTISANAVIIRNNETSGSKVVIVSLNSGNAAIATLTYGQKLTYSIKKVKSLKLKRDAAGAPNYSVSGVL